MIRIYLYNRDLSNKISLSKEINIKNNENLEKNIFTKKCFLINKEYIESYKNHYLYSELENLLDEYIQKNETIKKDSNDDIYSSKNIDIIYELLQSNNNIMEKYKSIEHYKINENDKNITTLKKKKLTKDENIDYYDDFIIINEEIYNYYFCSPNNNNDKLCIINSGRIIIFFEEGEIYQVLIGKLYSDYINLKFLINFIDNSEIAQFKEKLLKINLDELLQ